MASLLFSLLAAQALVASEPATIIDLWPEKPPDERGTIGPEGDMTKRDDRSVAGKPVLRLGNVSKPTICVFRPSASNNTGAAILVCPGGAYRILAIDLEGREVCDWLNSRGVTAVLLKYRVPKREGDDAHVLPLQDAQRAMALMRHRAKDWGFDQNRIGVLGFSAGGHLAANVSNNYRERRYGPLDEADQESCRPDFTLLIYPAYLCPKGSDQLAPELKITSETPPTFLLMTMDDPLRVQNVLSYTAALDQAKIVAELHVYPEGGHGYGLRREKNSSATNWPLLAEDWMRRQGFLRKPQ